MVVSPLVVRQQRLLEVFPGAPGVLFQLVVLRRHPDHARPQGLDVGREPRPFHLFLAVLVGVGFAAQSVADDVVAVEEEAAAAAVGAVTTAAEAAAEKAAAAVVAATAAVTAVVAVVVTAAVVVVVAAAVAAA